MMENSWIYSIFSFAHIIQSLNYVDCDKHLKLSSILIMVSNGQICLHEILLVQYVFVSLGFLGV